MHLSPHVFLWGIRILLEAVCVTCQTRLSIPGLLLLPCVIPLERGS